MNEYILELIEENKYSQVKSAITEMNVVDIASLLEELEKTKLLIVFRLLKKETAAEVFAYLTSQMQAYIVESITDREIENILEMLFLDDFVDLVEEVPANVVKKILKNTDIETRTLINQFLQYPVDSAGSIMTIEYVDLKADMTIKEATEYIKETGVDKATINTCYVLDQNRILEGTISIRRIILSDEDAIVGDIMEKNVIYTYTLDDQEVTADLFKKYDLLSMPVVDNENRLVGIVTIDDIVDVIELENTEDMQKMAAMHPSEDEYLKTSVWSLSKHRIVWLLILMFTATITGAIIQKYEILVQNVVLLAAFIPMLMDTGGNAGSQSSTLIIRGMALGEITTHDFFRVFWKETRVSILVGLILSAANFFRLMLISRVELNIAITVCASLFITVVVAKVVGGLLPMIASKLRLDPAIMAGPLITTIVDTISLFIYFGIASLFFTLT